MNYEEFLSYIYVIGAFCIKSLLDEICTIKMPVGFKHKH